MFKTIKNICSTVNPSPLLVVGNQKSGTSAIAHLLAAYGGLSKTIDIPPLWGTNGAQVMKENISFRTVVNQNKHYFSAELIKEPMMTFVLDHVLAYFENVNCIFVIRDPRENIRSLLDRRDLPADQSYLTEKDKEHLRPESIVVDSEVWGGAGTNYIGVLAHRWNRAVNSYLQYEDHLNQIQYEEFMEGKEQCISSLANQIGIEKKGSIRSMLNQQFQPKGKRRGIPWNELYGQVNLRRIEEICYQNMKRLGYERITK